MLERVDGFNALDLLHLELDMGVTKLEAARKAPICIEGCGKCCEQVTPMATSLEAALAVSMRTITPEALQRAKDWLVEPIPNVDTTFYPEQKPGVLSGDEVTGDQKQRAVEQYKEVIKGGCPFLAEDKRCMVYEHRPLICRTYGLTHIPHDYCERPKDQAEQDNPGAYHIDGPLGDKLQQAVHILQTKPKANPEMTRAGLWPMLVVLHADPEGFKKLVESGKVPLAKLIKSPPGMAYPGVFSQRVRDAADRAAMGTAPKIIPVELMARR